MRVKICSSAEREKLPSYLVLHLSTASRHSSSLLAFDDSNLLIGGNVSQRLSHAAGPLNDNLIDHRCVTESEMNGLGFLAEEVTTSAIKFSILHGLANSDGDFGTQSLPVTRCAYQLKLDLAIPISFTVI
jgi:hypothetical protein